MAERLKPFYNPGPGDIIKDAMKEFGWKNEDLAKNLGLPLKIINLILDNKQTITFETAELLEKAFSTSSEMWLKLYEQFKNRERLHQES